MYADLMSLTLRKFTYNLQVVILVVETTDGNGMSLFPCLHFRISTLLFLDFC